MSKNKFKIQQLNSYKLRKYFLFINIILFFSNIILFSNNVYQLLPKVNNLDDVISWCKNNLYYKNVDSWDKAPEIDAIIKDGYGDCKMLTGVVSVLLDSINMRHEFIVINSKKYGWHMFIIFKVDNITKFINNANLLKEDFKNEVEVMQYFKVDSFIKRFNNYSDFKSWFNNELYPEVEKKIEKINKSNIKE